MSSWAEVPDGSDFPIENLAMGVGHSGRGPARPHVAIGNHALDRAAVSADGLLDSVAGPEFGQPSLNAFLALGPPTWRAVRERLTELLDERSGQVEERIARGAKLLGRFSEHREAVVLVEQPGSRVQLVE